MTPIGSLVMLNLAFLCFILVSCSNGKQINLDVCLPELSESITNNAVKQANILLGSSNAKLETPISCQKTKTCMQKLGSQECKKLDAVIGGKIDCAKMIHMSKILNIPLISPLCEEAHMQKRNLHSNFVSIRRTGAGVGRALATALKRFGWKHIGMLTEGSQFAMTIRDDILIAIQTAGINLGPHNTTVSTKDYSFAKFKDTIERPLKGASVTSRIIVLVMSHELANKFLIAAWEMDLSQEDYGFIVVETNHQEMIKREQRNERKTKESLRLCRSWNVALVLAPKVEFENTKAIGLLKVALKTGFDVDAYDSIMIYSHIVNDMIATGEDYRNSTLFMSKLQNKQFTSVMGYHIQFNSDGRMEVPYGLYHYGETLDWQGNLDYLKMCQCALGNVAKNCTNDNPVSPELQMVGELTQTRNGNYKYHDKQQLEDFWPGKIPEGVPECGFDGKYCMETAMKFALLGVAVAIIAIGFGSFILVRRRRNQAEQEEEQSGRSERANLAAF